jgi:uncharacterized membrane protein
MLPEPLHPAVVHFPIVLAILLPIFAVGALWAIRRGASPLRAWALPVSLAGALALSAWVAVETGDAQEDRVEGVVAEEVFHAHEEAGERFLLLSGVLMLVMAGGLMGGRVGSASRWVGTVGAAGLVIAAIQVGDAGGKLVYQHGAAAAYVAPAATAGGSLPRAGETERPAVPAHEEDDD